MTEDAFKKMFAERKNAVYRCAWRMTDSAAIAEDIAQDVFVAAWRGEVEFDSSRGWNRGLSEAVTTGALMKKAVSLVLALLTCGGASQVARFHELVQEAQPSLTEKLTQIEQRKGGRDPVTGASIEAAEQNWKHYRDAACRQAGNETSRLRCELHLTRGRAHGLG